MAGSATPTVKTFANKLEAKIKAKLEKAKGKMHKLKPLNSNKNDKAAIQPADAGNNMALVELNNMAAKPGDLAVPAVEPSKAVVEPNNKDLIEEQIKAVFKPDIKAVADPASAKNNVVEPKSTKHEGQVNAQSTGCTTSNKPKDKATRRAEKRQARRDKWPTKRATFKAKAKKIGEALFFPAVVVGSVVFAPVILAIGIIFFAVKMVVLLVLHILDLVFCCPVLVCYVVSDV